MFVLTNTTKRFIPTSQKDSEKPLTFIVKPPTRKTILDFQETLFKGIATDSEGNEMTKIPLSAIMDILLSKCVVGWENVLDEEGNEVVFSEENFCLFNEAEVLTELYQFIKELSESTEKN